MDRCIPSSCSYTSTSFAFQSSVRVNWCRLHQQCKKIPKGSAVLCSSTRRFGPPGGDRGGRGGLILPGQGGGSQDGGQPKLIVPGGRGNAGGQQQGGRGGNTLGGGVLLDVESKPAVNAFRPPPGFMDADGPQEDATAAADVQDPQVLLNKLRASAGRWHELANLVPTLATLGIDNTIIEAETGIERVQLNAWTVSVQVYESLKRSGELSAEQLAYFDREDGAELLYEMRLLSVTSRPNLAAYIADNELDPPMATILSRSVKEQLRRKGETEGFSAAPGDCLAYKYYRDAVESKKEDAKLAYMEKGLEVAVTDAARAKLRSLAAPEEEEASAADSAPGARLEMFRLTREEMAFQPVPLLPNLVRLTAAALDRVPRLRQSGPFSAFTVPAAASDQQWVALPAWNLIRRARLPVAINIDDCLSVPSIVAAANPKTAEAKQRLRGQALLVLECSVEKVTENSFYLVERAEGTPLEMVEGARLDGATPRAQVLFCCRPPAMKLASSAETSALLQV